MAAAALSSFMSPGEQHAAWHLQNFRCHRSCTPRQHTMTDLAVPITPTDHMQGSESAL